jgi:hypothetical protein
LLYRREGVDHGNSGGLDEVEGGGRDGDIALFAGEGEAGIGAVSFLDVDGGDGAFGGHREGEALDPLFLTVRDSGEREGAVGGGRCREVIDFFFKLSVAEKEAQRGAEIVELFGGDALHLRVTGRVEPGEFAVEQEELAGRMGVVPAHAARFEEQEGSVLEAGATEAFVVLGELGFEGVELVVMAIDALGEVVDCGLLCEEPNAREQKQGKKGRALESKEAART